MRASPLLSPSLPVSLQKKTPGASALASRKAPIPPDAIRGFATVGSLVRSEHFAQPLDDNPDERPAAQSRRGSLEEAEQVTATKKKPRKRSTAIAATDGEDKPKPRPRARKPKAYSDKPAHDPELRLPAPKISPYFPNEETGPSTEPADAIPKLTKSGKPRKPRAKKEKLESADAEPKPKKTRVAKPKGAVKAIEKSQQEDACVESAHFRNNATTAQQHEISKNVETADASIWEVPDDPPPKKKRAPKQRPPDTVVERLDLDEAVLRRRDWTPPKDTAIASPLTESAGKENKQIEPDADAGHFTNMISNFAYAHSPSVRMTTSMAPSTTDVVAVTKRRRVELVDLPGNQSNSRNSSPEKGKAPKKKARTITDRATEQYQSRTVDLGPSGATSDLFQPQTTVTKVPLNDTTTSNGGPPPKKPPRKRSTSKSDSEKVASKPRTKKTSFKSAAKAKPIAEKLLSPGSALMRISKQDMLFGTSSQLALEESPTLVRQIQQAMKESEQDADRSLHKRLNSPPRWPGLERAAGKHGLWDASSRDVEGGLLEQMEDVYIPEFDRTQDFPLLMDGTNDAPDDVPDSFVDIDDIPSVPAVIISSDLPTPPGTTSQGSQTVHDAHSRVVNSQPPPSNQNARSQDSFVDIEDLLPNPIQSSTFMPPKPRPPAADHVTDSPKKRRGRPPKSQSSTSATGVSRATSSMRKTKPKAQPKTLNEQPAVPPKTSSRFVDIDEIFDSEDEATQALSPTPPRVRRFSDSQPLPLFTVSPTRPKRTKEALVDPTIVHVHRIPSTYLDWSNLRPSVFASITAHVRAQPPTTNPSRPSWYERILMYDPVVLEDLTAHLNVSTGVRSWRRATKAQTKAWNKEMKKSGEDEVFAHGEEVLAIERDLEAWMVREWCESLSVCCIYGDRKVGGARKGYY
ncbi:structure-specific endonuclease subunit SLX4 [Ophiobolus disseminans]|uniref:Structure-specific endonuclease subunit SLX4 n=1 Tax=Ophiobolus disseminans TaxID=1469910 RepID=A0A6A6ZQ01_9PLEO|nr:structure-specific endonuclease subunit SLX4 [Ophiobolus disseminans]